MRILFVHGRSQGGKSEAVLLSEWQEALDMGLAISGDTLDANLTFDMPFYGDVLDDFVERANLPSPTDIVRMGTNSDHGFEQFAQSTLLEISVAGGIGDVEIQQEMPAGPKEMGPQNWEWVQALVKVIDKRWPKISGYSIERFLQDVYLYLDKPIVRKAIDRIVEEKLREERTLIVGHSLGSVVAYNVLRQNKIDVAGFITIGSPLGIKAVTGQLGLPSNPAGSLWFNAYDERDIVALNPLDAMHFPVAPEIENFSEVKNGTANRHGISGYLGDGTVARKVTGWSSEQN